MRNCWQKRLIVGETVGETVPPDWLNSSYEIFHTRLTHPKYPCYFGSLAEQRNDLYYSFVDSKEPWCLPQTLRTFVKISSKLVSRRNNLAVFFEPESIPRTHADQFKRTWEILQDLHDQDAEPWLEEVPADPSDHRWEFCFNGTMFFVVALSPTYALRNSRNMGPGLILLFQPRDVFVDPRTGENIGEAARDLIRARLQAWDDVDVHPDLGVFADPDKNEWKQYFLSDDVKPESGRCPFRVNALKRTAASE